jgi:RNA polymerase sigma factor (sigma-70 family)
MSEPAPDSEAIPPDDLSDDPENRLLRRYRRARLRGDEQAALELWEQLVLGDYDLMRTKVAGMVARRDFRWISAGEVDDVAQQAYLRAMTMALRFEHDTVGQLRAALIKTAVHTARDYERRLHVRKRDVTGSLDDTREYEDGGEYNPWEADAAGGDWTSEQALGRIGAQRILDAIAMIPNENQRAVIALTWAGYDSKTIATRLELTVPNVDQLRKRGLAKLKELLTDDGFD